VASKLGVGKFSNVYGISSNNVTAGQKDYAARMLQIEKQREDYYRKLGTPPGVPTMKGATADPDNTGYGYNTIIGELGDHSVPEGWVQRPKFNNKGDVPGPPIQWQKPEDPDNAQPGYGYVPTDTTNIEEIFFYHSDHLGSTSYITDAKANITQFDAYLPYGELLVDEHSSTEEMPYKFNGKEFDQETGLYYYGARYMNPVTSLWYGVDPMMEKYPGITPYCYTYNNPIVFYDPDGRTGEIVYNKKDGVATVYAKLYFYGSKASSKLSQQIVTGIASQWNGAHASINYRGKDYKVRFRISYETISTEKAEQLMKENKSARNNFVRVESGGNKSSFTVTSTQTGGGNSFWFNTKDDLAHTTTPAHEFGHGLGLEHPEETLDKSTSRPHIMIPRQTPYGSKWSIQNANGKRVVNPNSRRVTKENVNDAYWSNWGNYRNNKAVNIYIEKNGSY